MLDFVHRRLASLSDQERARLGEIVAQLLELVGVREVRNGEAPISGRGDLIGQWLKARCILEPYARSLTRDLYRDFVNWALASGHTSFPSSRRFVRILTRWKGLARWVDEGRTRPGFQGIRLRAVEGG